jgi:GTPase involved in cell partitioning and DNA repair
MARLVRWAWQTRRGNVPTGRDKEMALPVGRDGGACRSVWFWAHQDLESLRMKRPLVRQRMVVLGASVRRKCRSSEDVVVRVPPGTVVHTADEDHMLLCDLDGHHTRAQAARCGLGRKGNASFKVVD